MGRKRQPIEDTGPVGQFATALRARIDQEGSKVTCREMARGSNWAASTLSEATSGKKLPSWPIVKSILEYCGADDIEISHWAGRWRQTKEALAGLPTDQAQPRLDSSAEDWRPRPDLVRTFDDLACELFRLKILAGNPPLRVLVRQLQSPTFGAALCSVSGLSDVFKGKRRPNVKWYGTLIHVLLQGSLGQVHAGESERPWRSVFAWTEAWTRAEFHRLSAGGKPAADDRADPVLIPPTRLGDRSAISELAAKEPTLAAKMLVDMKPKVVSDIISALPPADSARILNLVLELHWKKGRAS